MYECLEHVQKWSLNKIQIFTEILRHTSFLDQPTCLADLLPAWILAKPWCTKRIYPKSRKPHPAAPCTTAAGADLSCGKKCVCVCPKMGNTPSWMVTLEFWWFIIIFLIQIATEGGFYVSSSDKTIFGDQLGGWPQHVDHMSCSISCQLRATGSPSLMRTSILKTWISSRWRGLNKPWKWMKMGGSTCAYTCRDVHVSLHADLGSRFIQMLESLSFSGSQAEA